MLTAVVTWLEVSTPSFANPFGGLNRMEDLAENWAPGMILFPLN